VEKLPGFVKLMAAAKAKIEPAEKALADAQKKHGQDVQKVSAALPHTDLFQVIQEIEMHIENVAQRRVVAQQLFGTYLTRSIELILKLSDRVNAVEEQFSEVADVADKEEIIKVESACKKARDCMEAFQKNDIPALKLEGPVGIDLEGDDDLMAVEGGICPKVTKFLEKATDYVTQAEVVGEELFVVKLKFRSMIQALLGQQEGARARLEALQEPVRRCLAANIEGVAEVVNAAWTQEYECQEILKRAKDADGYRLAVASLEASIAEAETTVKNAADALKKREAEAIERRAIQARIDMLQQEVDDARVGLSKRVEQELGPGESSFSMEVQRLQQDICSLRDAGTQDLEIAVWRSSVDDVTKRVHISLADLEHRIHEVGRKRREEFKKRFGMFDKAPASAPVEEPLMAPEAFISASGMGAYEESLMELHDTIETLKEAGAPRASLNRCITHFVKLNFGNRLEGSTRSSNFS